MFGFDIPEKFLPMFLLCGGNSKNEILHLKSPRGPKISIATSDIRSLLKFSTEDSGPFRATFHFKKKKLLAVLSVLYDNEYPDNIRKQFGIQMPINFHANLIPIWFVKDLNLEYNFNVLFGSNGTKFKITRENWGDFSLKFAGHLETIQFSSWNLYVILKALRTKKDFSQLRSLGQRLWNSESDDSSSEDSESDDSSSDDSSSEDSESDDSSSEDSDEE